MYWDGTDAFGDDTADIEILSNDEHIEIPENACGFRLGMPNENWNEYWYFAEPMLGETEFTSFGITYSSSFFTGPSPDAIEARGPVHGCGRTDRVAGTGAWPRATSAHRLCS